MSNKSDLYKLIIETANEGIWVVDENNVTTFTNPKMNAILGYSEDEMTGRNLFSFMDEGGEKLARKYLYSKEVGKSKTLELRFLSKNGGLVWAHIKSSPIVQGGKFSGGLAMLTDITKKKELEEEQQVLIRNYRSLFEDSPVPIWDEDFSEVKKRVDHLKEKGVKNFRKHFDENEDDLLHCAEGLKVNDLNQAVIDLNEASSKKQMIENFTSLSTDKSIGYAKEQIIAVANGQTSFEQEFELKTFKGNIRHALMKWTVVNGYEESYERVYLSTTDLTDKIIEENKFLHKTNKEKEVLLKEIHHRVKNNLQIIMSLLNLQSRNILDEKTKNLFQVSVARVQSMSIVHELLYQSKDFEKIDYRDYLKVLIAPLIQSMKPQDKDVSIELGVDEITLNVGTSIPLGLVINEIVTNSLKHGIKDKKGRINIEMLNLKNGKFQLNIGDDGVGLPEDINVDNTETLGLQLVSSLVEQLEGQLTMDTSKKGTHYVLIFEELLDNSMQ